MSRPSSHDDLTDWQRQGHLVALIASDYITRYPSIGQHLLAAVAEADRLSLLREDDGTIRIPLTAGELDAKLRSDQRSWDWAKNEGLDPIDWDALDAGGSVSLVVTQ